MLVTLLMFVIFKDDLVHKRSKCHIGIVGSSIYSNARVDMLATREDSLLEREAVLILFVFELIPCLGVKSLAQKTFSAFWEFGHVFKIFRLLKLTSTFSEGASVGSS